MCALTWLFVVSSMVVDSQQMLFHSDCGHVSPRVPIHRRSPVFNLMWTGDIQYGMTWKQNKLCWYVASLQKLSQKYENSGWVCTRGLAALVEKKESRRNSFSCLLLLDAIGPSPGNSWWTSLLTEWSPHHSIVLPAMRMPSRHTTLFCMATFSCHSWPRRQC